MIDELTEMLKSNILRKLKNSELEELKKKASDSVSELKAMISSEKPLKLIDTDIDEQLDEFNRVK